MSGKQLLSRVDESRPLLSICIPTFNRAGFLKVMLQALLPQVQEFGDEVEVWVLDNASTDDTAQVLADARQLGTFQVLRQQFNVGPTRNIVCGPATLATGYFVWVLGDHNLLRPGALKRVIECLRTHQSYDYIYANFRCASFPDHWPESSVNGHEGVFQYIGNPEVRDGVIAHWHELLRPGSALCTQNYVHIVATNVWRNFWKNGVPGGDYTSVETTYPHTVTIVKSGLFSPAVVIADPVITIFNGAQSWGNPVTRVKVYFVGLPGLIRLLQTSGLPLNRLRELQALFFLPEAQRVVREACRQLGRRAGLQLVVSHLGPNLYSWWGLLAVAPEILLPRLTRCFRQLAISFRDYRSWYVYNFRPARWMRLMLSGSAASKSSSLPDGDPDRA